MSKKKPPEIKEEFWDNYWNKLSKKAVMDKRLIQKRTKFFPSILSIEYRKFILPTAALILILFGLFLGKILFSPQEIHILQKNNEVFPHNKNAPYYTTINNHIDNLIPILTEYSNFQTTNKNNTDFLSVKKETLKNLLLQNYLLKRLADKKNDKQLKLLIDNLQLILLELINNNSTEEEKINNVKSLLNGDDMIFKMNLFKKNRSTWEVI
jgi:predicted RND superfamily exporter protein